MKNLNPFPSATKNQLYKIVNLSRFNRDLLEIFGNKQLILLIFRSDTFLLNNLLVIIFYCLLAMEIVLWLYEKIKRQKQMNLFWENIYFLTKFLEAYKEDSLSYIFILFALFCKVYISRTRNRQFSINFF